MIAREEIIGTWILEKYLIIGEDGTQTEISTGYRGILIYSEQGSVSVTICPYPPSAKTSTSELVAYAGHFEVSNGSIIHHILTSSVARYLDSAEKRDAHLENDRLTLSTRLSTTGQIHEVTWTRSPPPSP